MLYAFGGEQRQEALSVEAMDAVLVLMQAHATLRADAVASWPAESKTAAREHLTRLLMFVSMFPDLPFPPGFLSGSSKTRLGEPVIAYMREHRDDLAALGQTRA